MTLVDGPRQDVALMTVDEVISHQVLQRGSDKAVHLEIGDALGPGERLLAAGPHGLVVAAVETGTLTLPTGGPYDLLVESGGGRRSLATDVLVGDLWLLAGQSNMEGCGTMRGRELPGPTVRVLDMHGGWRTANDPLHLRWLSPHPVYAEIADEMERHNLERSLNDTSEVVYMDGQIDDRDVEVGGFRTGVGPGVSFANELVRRTGVPVGLLPVSQGGTSMDQWSPERPHDGSSLFGASLLTVRAAGGQVRGILWYQGEADSNTDKPWTYGADLDRLFTAYRTVLGSDLRVLCVQLGRYALPDRGHAFDMLWSQLREAQRTAPTADATVTAADLSLIDPIHIDTAGQLRLGRRLARCADGVPAIDLAGVEVVRSGLAIRVTFRGVIGRLHGPAAMVPGFSLRDAGGDVSGLVFAVELDGDEAELRLSRPVRPGEHLYYGFGADPHIVLVDEDDMAVPAFGPIPLHAS